MVRPVLRVLLMRVCASQRKKGVVEQSLAEMSERYDVMLGSKEFSSCRWACLFHEGGSGGMRSRLILSSSGVSL